MEINLQKITCCVCGIVFGVEEEFVKSLKQTHASFHCPNGHSLGYISETDAEKYKRLFDAESKRKEELLQINAKLNDEKALLQRQLKKKKRK